MRKILCLILVGILVISFAGCGDVDPVEKFNKYGNSMLDIKDVVISGIYKSADDEFSFTGGRKATGELELAQVDTSEIHLIKSGDRFYLKYPKELSDYISFDIKSGTFSNLLNKISTYRNVDGSGIISFVKDKIHIVVGADALNPMLATVEMPSVNGIAYLTLYKESKTFVIEARTDNFDVKLKLIPTKDYKTVLSVPQNSVTYRQGMFDEEEDTMTPAEKSEKELGAFFDNKYPNAVAIKTTLTEMGYEVPEMKNDIKKTSLYGKRASRSSDFKDLYDETHVILKDDIVSEIVTQAVFSQSELDRYGADLIDGIAADIESLCGMDYLLNSLDVETKGDWSEATDDWLFEYSIKDERLMEDTAVVIRLSAIKY